MHTIIHWIGRSGCGRALVAAVLGLILAAAASADVQTVRSTRLELEYSVAPEAKPLAAVGLWYTADEGKTWEFLSEDPDRQSPAVVEAPSEGLLGFYFVLGNASGDSSPPPQPGTAPHVSVVVDATPPVVQLHPLQETQSLGRRAVRIRWTAVDAHLAARPIELFYRPATTDVWAAISNDPLANTGQYDWLPPEELEGVVELRLTATDQAGHRSESEIQRLDLSRLRTGEVAWVTRGTGSAARRGQEAAESLSPEAKQRAERLLIEGLVDRDRGDYRQGVAKLRRAVEIDPFLTEAFAEMGGMLAQLGAEDRALAAYDIALMQNPRMRPALQGSARVLSKRGDYSGAAQRLRTILRADPADGEIWLNLGDVAVYQGDEILARDCYERAARIDPKATETIEQARRRLMLMSDVDGRSTGAANVVPVRRVDAAAARPGVR